MVRCFSAPTPCKRNSATCYILHSLLGTKPNRALTQSPPVVVTMFLSFPLLSPFNWISLFGWTFKTPVYYSLILAHLHFMCSNSQHFYEIIVVLGLREELAEGPEGRSSVQL